MTYYESYDIERITKLVHGTSKGLFLGYGAIQKFGEIIDDLKPSCIGFVTSSTAYKRCGAWDVIETAMNERGIPHLLYDKISTNPMVEMIDEAVALFRSKYDENFVVCSIGGGSPGDSAKSIAVLLAHPEANANARALYMGTFTAERRAKLVMVNITHGTGTECDMFAVASILTGEEYPFKPALATPVIYPDYSIDDVNAMLSMSADMIRFTSIDALNHVMEAATTICSTPYSCTLAREVVLLVHRYLPIALKDPQHRRARYWLTYAAAIAGMAFDESLLHLTHALEHTLSAYKPHLIHGQGLALLQPAVLKHIWPKVCGLMPDLFRPILGSLQGTPEEAQKAFDRMRAFHNKVGFTGTLADLGFSKDDIDVLTEATWACPGMMGLLALSPVPCEKEDARRIFQEAFYE
ncbi:Alcohol dehydrogenase 3 [Giardia muris]|uniref:Alcohol dehydrogenase 3 n=1 Tax=Giardia muris TaxID=5742 RepID=A0A4Z1SSA4_GIAMU|nr:Alcohol dehydrogenase 3 [Giardia muris]|eukprot:TNJ28776.1 Alcohol dehydrogenase 3 [Giardia muris]